jgi:hypothetical protein
MSGAARRRGGRGPNDDTSEASSRRSLGTPTAPPGGFDGPASRGSASGPASAGRGRGSNPPSAAGSAPSSQPTSPRLSQTGFGTMTTSQAGSQPGSRAGAPPASQGPMRGDPARDQQSSYFDQMKNVDLPPSFYNFDERVRDLCLLTAELFLLLHYSFTSFRAFVSQSMNPLLHWSTNKSMAAFMPWSFELLLCVHIWSPSHWPLTWCSTIDPSFPHLALNN